MSKKGQIQYSRKTHVQEVLRGKNSQADARSKNVLFYFCGLTFETEQVESLTARSAVSCCRTNCLFVSAVSVVEMCSALAHNSKAFVFAVWFGLSRFLSLCYAQICCEITYKFLRPFSRKYTGFFFSCM